MLTIKATKTATRQVRFTCNGRRHYCSNAVLGTTCETRALRAVVYGNTENAIGAATLRAPGHWPHGSCSRMLDKDAVPRLAAEAQALFDRQLAEINASHPDWT